MFFVMGNSGFVEVGELSESDVFLDGGFRILNVGSDDKRNDSDESDSHHCFLEDLSGEIGSKSP